MCAKENQRGRNKNKTPTSKATNLHSKIDYVAIINTSLDGFCIADLQGRFLDVNDSICRMLGYTHEELLAKSIADIEVSETLEETAQHIEKLVKQGYDRFETCLKHKDGHTIYCEISATYSSSDSGHIIFFCRDITESKQAEETLRESEKKLKSIVENSSDQIFMLDKDYKYITVNRAMADDLNKSTQEVIGRLIFEIFPEETADQFSKNIKYVFDTGDSLHLEEKIFVQGRELYISTSLNPVKDDKGNVIAVTGITRDITEQRKVEEALRTSEKRYRSYIEVSGGLGWTTNADGEVVEDIPSFRQFTGQSYEEVYGWGWSKAIHPDDLENTIKAWKKAVEQRTGYETEYRLRRYDGIYRYFLTRGVPTLRENGSIREWVGTCIDITERKQAEEATRKSEERYRTLFESTKEAVVISAPDGTILSANPAAASILGYDSPQDLVGMLGPDLYIDLQQRKNVQAALLHDGYMNDMEVELRKKDGTPVNVLGSSIIHRDQQGNPIRVESVWTDITERRRIETLVAENARFLQHLIDTIPTPIFYKDKNGIYTGCNIAFEKYIGLPKEQVVGKSVFDISPKDLANIYYARDRELIDKPGIQIYESRVKYADGSIHDVIFNKATFTDSKGNVEGIVEIILDISERKLAEQKIQEALRSETEARRAAQEEIKKRVEFTRLLVHELKTPLTSLVASSGLLAEELPEGPLLRMAKNMNRSTHDLNNRIDELLDVARGELGILKLKLTSVDSFKMLQELAEKMYPVALNRHQSLILNLPSKLPRIRADESRLQQVVLNLMNNACKFTGEGGTITLKAREDGDKLIVEVEDTGPGMTESEQQMIFNAYYRGEVHKNRVIGLGLGLTLCKTLVELHGGQIWIRSTLGKGSTFGFSIPIEAVR